MYKRINTHHRQRGDHDDGIFDQLRHFSRLIRRRTGEHGACRLAVDQNGADHQLQGLKVVVSQIDHRRKIRVPVRNGVPQPDHGDDRLGQRQHDPDKIADAPQPVDLCRLPQISRNAGLKKGPGDDHIINGNRSREYDRPDRVIKPQVPDVQIGRNQSAAEKHGDEKEHINELVAEHILSRQSIAGRQIDHQREERPHGRIKDGVAVSDPEVLILQQGLVALHIESDRKEIHLAQIDCVRVADGGDDHKIHGVQHDQQQNDTDRINDNVKQEVSPASSDAGRLALCQFHGFSSLQQRCILQLVADLVHDQQQNEPHQRIEQPDGRRLAELVALDTQLIDIGRNDLAGGKIHIVLQQQDLFVSDAENASATQNELDADGGRQRRQVDIADLLPFGGSVQGRRFIIGGVNGGQRRNIKDAVPA